MESRVILKNAVEAAQSTLRALQIGLPREASLVRPLGILSGVLSSLGEKGDAALVLAKDACEAIIECAHYAEDAGDSESAEQLRRVVGMLSPVVAGSYRLLRKDGPILSCGD